AGAGESGAAQAADSGGGGESGGERSYRAAFAGISLQRPDDSSSGAAGGGVGQIRCCDARSDQFTKAIGAGRSSISAREAAALAGGTRKRCTSVPPARGFFAAGGFTIG